MTRFTASLGGLLCLAVGALLWAPQTAMSDASTTLLFEDDFSSYATGAFPKEKWVTDDECEPFVRVAGIGSPIGLQLAATESLVYAEPRVEARDSFVFEWGAHAFYGRGLSVAVRDPVSAKTWGITLSPLGAEYSVLGDGANPFKGRSVRAKASTPAHSLYAEHDYLLSVRPGTCELFCDGYSLLMCEDDVITGGVPRIVAIPGTLPLVKHARIWEHAALRSRMKAHRANAEPRHSAAKSELEDPLWPSKKGELEPIDEPRPFETVFPRSPAPDANLRVVRADQIMQCYGADLFLSLVSLQGLANRTQPRIYVQTNPGDPWPEWLKERGDVEKLTFVSDPALLFDEFRDCADGLVVLDPWVNATINVATAVASVENLIIAHPDFADQLPWEVRHDLRGRWSSNADAYRWAHRKYWDKMNHHVLGCTYPHDIRPPRDYMIAFKILPFYVSARTGGNLPEADAAAELRFAEELLAQTPPNIPVLGWESDTTGIGEHNAVRMFSYYGKFLVPSPANLSVLSGTKRGTYSQPPLEAVRPLDTSKVYITFTMSDGDNLATWYDFFQRYFQDPARGDVPIAWTLGLGAYDLYPAVIDWYYRRLTPVDTFICAFGIGYVRLDSIGLAYRQPEQVYRQFMRVSGQYMRHLDQNVVWSIFEPIVEKTPDQFNRINHMLGEYADENPWLTAFLPGYGYSPAYGYDYEASKFITKAGVPVFHAIAPSRAWLAGPEDIVRQLRERLGDTRPAFAHVFAFNWRISPTIIKKITEELGEDYVAVRPDELARLYLAWRDIN